MKKKFIFLLMFFCTFLIAKESNLENLQKNKNLAIKEQNIKDQNIKKNQKKDINSSQSIDKALITKALNDANQTNENNATEDELEDASKLSDLVDQIRQINTQVGIIKAQKGDLNASSSEIKSILDNKNFLFEQLPSAITNQKINKKEVMQYLKTKKHLQNEVKKYSKNQTSNKYVNALLNLKIMEFSDIFYLTLIKIEDMFINGTNKEELQKTLQKALIEIQTKDYVTLQKLKEQLSDDQKSIFDEKYSQLENYRKTYEEILSYLLKNTDLLASNMIFTMFDLRNMIDVINSKFPIKSKKINFGKIILILSTIVIFYSLRRFFAQIIYLFIKIFNNNKEKNEIIKTQVIDIIKKPIGFLLIVYAFDVCLSIFYYPAPVPIKFGNSFSILYIVFYAWVLVEILNGLGIIILSNLAKKSGRKEIINLIIKILYIIVVIVTILLILKRLGFDVSAILASLGIGGFAIALATKDIIANFLASVLLLFDNSISQGDLITIDDIEGKIVETGLRKTIIRTADNALIFVPNSKMIESNIKNWNRRKIGRRIQITVGVTYDATAKQLNDCIEKIKEVLLANPGIAKPNDSALSNKNNIRLKYRQNMVSVDDLAGYKNAMHVVLSEFADSSINIYVECFTKTILYGEFLEQKQKVLFDIMQIVEDLGLSFAFPSQSLYIEKYLDQTSINQKDNINLNIDENMKKQIEQSDKINSLDNSES